MSNLPPLLPYDGQTPVGKRHLSPAQARFVLGLFIGLFIGAVVGVVTVVLL